MLRPHPTALRITRDDLADYDEQVAERERQLQEEKLAQKKRQDQLRKQAQIKAHLRSREGTPVIKDEDDEEMEDVDEEEIRRQQVTNAERRERRGRVMGGRK